jgi:hypothetical protein
MLELDQGRGLMTTMNECETVWATRRRRRRRWWWNRGGGEF